MLKNITVLFGISMLWIHASQEPEKFGQYIGQNSLTPAYSNGHEDHVSDVPHYIIVDDYMVKTGMKWQCVEYARRWLIQNKGVTFDDVTYAWQIWDLPESYKIRDYTPIQTKRFVNGHTHHQPRRGDLLILDESYAPVTGHVSVVCSVGAHHVFVAEQNYSNAQWHGPDYSQSYVLSTLPSDKAENKLMYKILEKGLLGWIRF